MLYRIYDWSNRYVNVNPISSFLDPSYGYVILSHSLFDCILDPRRHVQQHDLGSQHIQYLTI